MDGWTDGWMGNRISGGNLVRSFECGAIENWRPVVVVVMCYVYIYIYTHNIFKYTPL